ncbi:MAG TPA: hypothetical protein PKN36_10290, partial [bacterium]|nr:hypothetical protein [bacterium]
SPSPWENIKEEFGTSGVKELKKVNHNPSPCKRSRKSFPEMPGTSPSPWENIKEEFGTSGVKEIWKWRKHTMWEL